MTNDTDPVTAAVQALTVTHPADRDQAAAMLNLWAHRDQLDDQAVTEVLDRVEAARVADAAAVLEYVLDVDQHSGTASMMAAGDVDGHAEQVAAWLRALVAPAGLSSRMGRVAWCRTVRQYSPAQRAAMDADQAAWLDRVRGMSIDEVAAEYGLPVRAARVVADLVGQVSA